MGQVMLIQLGLATIMALVTGLIHLTGLALLTRVLRSHSRAFRSLRIMPLTLLLSRRDLRVASFNLISGRFADCISKKVPFLNHKIAALTNFCTVIAFHCLLESEAVFGYFACCFALWLGEASVGVAESVGALNFFGHYMYYLWLLFGGFILL
jgi:hypothetical protein